jgi:hypothetical protein
MILGARAARSRDGCRGRSESKSEIRGRSMSHESQLKFRDLSFQMSVRMRDLDSSVDEVELVELDSSVELVELDSFKSRGQRG